MKYRKNLKNSKRFLVIRTDRIGDVVLSTPVLTAIKHSFSDAFTAMLVRPYTRDIVSGHPDLDLILEDDNRGCHKGLSGMFALAKEIRKYKFDIVLILHPTLRLALLCWLARIPLRVGTSYRLYALLFNRKVFHHRKTSNRHELDLNLDLTRAIDADLINPKLTLFVTKTEINKIVDRLKDGGLKPNDPYIVIHPGSGGSAMDWPLQKFGELAQRIINELKYPVILTGNKAEKSIVDQVVNAAHEDLIRFDGELSIKELAALLKMAKLLITNSTGPLHMAVALETEVVGLYCPIHPCAPERWGPYGRPDSVLIPQVADCRKCNSAKCQHYNCMELISVQQVFDKVSEKL